MFLRFLGQYRNEIKLSKEKKRKEEGKIRQGHLIYNLT